MDITLADLLVEVAHHLQADPTSITPSASRRRSSEILAAALLQITKDGEDPAVVLEDMERKLGELPAPLEAACSPVWGPVPVAA